MRLQAEEKTPFPREMALYRKLEILYISQAEALAAFLPWLSSKNAVYSRESWKVEVVSPKGPMVALLTA